MGRLWRNNGDHSLKKKNLIKSSSGRYPVFQTKYKVKRNYYYNIHIIYHHLRAIEYHLDFQLNRFTNHHRYNNFHLHRHVLLAHACRTNR